jgi:hypothetical protein
MGKVILDISLSLEGYMRAANPSPDEPLGDGGHRLHDWAFGEHEHDRRMVSNGVRSTGAVIAGRRTYDDSLRWWG